MRLRMERPMRIRLVIAALMLAVIGVSLVPSRPAATGAPPAAPAQVDHVAAIGLTVSDLDRSVDFYTRVLFFEKVGEVEERGEDMERLTGVAGARARTARLRLGDETLELTEYRGSRGRSAPADARSNDRWFQHVAIIVNDMDQAYLWLQRHHVQHVSPEPQRLPDWNSRAGGIRAFYFRDPDGHPLEILEFPPDKGDPRWRRPGDRVFLGIDHTAIVVGDTGASLRFYRDVLGFRVAGASENWGPEQERLNGVPGARLRITSLRTPGPGPAVEFLEYLGPRDGRAYPADARANDLLHWQTVMVTRDVPAALRTFRDHRFGLVSPAAVTFADSGPRPHQGFLARDPDGHALLLRSP